MEYYTAAVCIIGLFDIFVETLDFHNLTIEGLSLLFSFRVKVVKLQVRVRIDPVQTDTFRPTEEPLYMTNNTTVFAFAVPGEIIVA